MTNSDHGRALMENRQISLPGSEPEEEFMADEHASASLSLLAQPVDPPDDLLASIEAEIDEGSTSQSDTRRSSEGEWIKRTDLVWQKILHSDPNTGHKIYYLRCKPGAVIAPHQHKRDEHALVLEGSFNILGTTIQAGDSHFSRAGSMHSEITSPNGCLILVHA